MRPAVLVSILVGLALVGAGFLVGEAAAEKKPRPSPPPPTSAGFATDLTIQYWPRMRDAQQTPDGGYIAAGYHSLNLGGYPFRALLVKLDSYGNVQWSESYGASSSYAQAIRQTPDGGFAFAGSTTQSPYPEPCYDGCAWIVKTDSKGNVEWQRAFTGLLAAGATDLGLTSDGGYVVAGITRDSSHLYYAWVARLDSGGNPEWEQRIGCSSTGCTAGAQSVQQTSDGGFVLSGSAGDAGFVAKLGSAGDVQWQKSFPGVDYLPSIQQASDGGYIATGQAGHTTGWVAEWTDLVALKLDPQGRIEWQREYEGPYICYPISDDCDYAPASSYGVFVRQTSDGGFAFAGSLYGGGWLLRTDSNGNLRWQKSHANASLFYSIRETADGGFVSASFGGQVVKVDSAGNIAGCASIRDSAATVFTPAFVATDTSLPSVGVSSSTPSGAGAEAVAVGSTKEC